jgi:hypothetical protein
LLDSPILEGWVLSRQAQLSTLQDQTKTFTSQLYAQGEERSFSLPITLCSIRIPDQHKYNVPASSHTKKNSSQALIDFF